jgi:hypothetical protein
MRDISQSIRKRHRSIRMSNQHDIPPTTQTTLHRLLQHSNILRKGIFRRVMARAGKLRDPDFLEPDFVQRGVEVDVLRGLVEGAVGDDYGGWSGHVAICCLGILTATLV